MCFDYYGERVLCFQSDQDSGLYGLPAKPVLVLDSRHWPAGPPVDGRSSELFGAPDEEIAYCLGGKNSQANLPGVAAGRRGRCLRAMQGSTDAA